MKNNFRFKSIKYYRLILPCLILSVLFFLLSCATIVSPTGGPKDVSAPKVIEYKPENLSKNFNSNKIVLKFDEYINLENAEKNIFISPPITPKPKFKVKGKSLHININSQLSENTTYTIFIGDAIKDITENNKTQNLAYAFSTGDYIDTLQIKGRVLNALTHKPVENAFVLLYNSFNDSLPLTSEPTYISKTNKNGNFEINNIKFGNYKIFSILDMNNDLKYNLPTEEIAFNFDTIVPKDIVNPGDSTIKNTINEDILLYMFLADDTVQKIVENKAINEHRLRLIFNLPIKDVELKFPFENDNFTVHKEISATNDTLHIWIPQNTDTLTLIVKADNIFSDTLNFKNILPKIDVDKDDKIKNSTAKKASDFIYKNTAKSGSLPFFEPVKFEFDNPIEKVLNNNYVLINSETSDTTTEVLSYPDKIFRFLEINLKKPLSSGYTVIIPENTFQDIYNYKNDSIVLKFGIGNEMNYGQLRMTISSPNDTSNIVAQIIDENEKVLKSIKGKLNQKFDFGFLRPLKYTLRLFYDNNNDGIWNSGNYNKKTFPEKVIYYNKPIEIRSNWELEEDWIIN